MSTPTLRHRIEYAVARSAAAALGVLPERVALALGAFIGWLVGGVFRIRRRQVVANLAIAFPGADPAWIQRVTLASYRHLGRESVATVRFAGATREEILQRTEVVGLEAVQEATEPGVGVVFATGHLGNLEIGGAALAAVGLPFVAVARHQRNPLFDRWLRRMRERLGMRVLLKLDAAREAGALLGEGAVLGLPADQDARARGVFVDFFGRPASTPAGPAVFCLRYRAPLFVVGVFVVPGATKRYRVVIERVPSSDGARAGKAAVTALTQAYTRMLESWIREAPEQYFWQHRRWKTPPPGGTGTPPRR